MLFVRKRSALWLLACLASLGCLSAHAQQFTFNPPLSHAEDAQTAILCTTPAGWQSWKNDPHYWDHIDPGSRKIIEGAQSVSVWFHPPGCAPGHDCPQLALETFGLDSLADARDLEALKPLLHDIRQHQGNEDPDPVVTRFTSLDGGTLGKLTVWQIRSPFYRDYLVTVSVRGDVAATIYLVADDIGEIKGHLASLEELARSVRTAPASSTTPDMIRLDPGQPDEAIRGRLLRFTPRGMPMREWTISWRTIFRKNRSMA